MACRGEAVFFTEQCTPEPKVCQNLNILTKFGSHHIGPLKIIFHKYMYSYVKTDPVRCWKRNVF